MSILCNKTSEQVLILTFLISSDWNGFVDHKKKDNRELETCLSFLLPVIFAFELIYHLEIKCQLDATDDFYCRSYCLLNMFRAPLCPSSGAREDYTSGCCLSYLVLWFSSCRYGVELRFMCPAAARKPDTQPSAPHHTDNLKTKHQIRQAATTCIILPSSWWWA